MFCDQCAAYVSHHRQECPYCGTPLRRKKETRIFNGAPPGSPRYYCEQCRSSSYHQVCPVHQTAGILIAEIITRPVSPPPAPAGTPLPSSPAAGLPDPRQAQHNTTILPPNSGAAATPKHTAPETRNAVSGNDAPEAPYTRPAGSADAGAATPYPEAAAYWNTPGNEFPATSLLPASWPGRILGIAFLLFCLAIAGGAAMLYFGNFQSDNRSALYGRAETMLLEGQLAEALADFQVYRERYPQDPALPLVNEQIAAIEKELSALNQRIDKLMDRAELAVSKKHYLTPPSQHAVYFLGEVLALNPNHPQALEMLDRIVGIYESEARDALAEKNYWGAIRLYQSILQIRPHNVFAMNEIERIRAILPATVHTAEGVTVDGGVSAAFWQTASGGPTGNLSSGDQTQSSQPELSSTAAPAEVPLVIEALVDGGRRHYRHRIKPEIPEELRGEGLIMIRGECTVGLDGKVEAVRLITPSSVEALNQLAIHTFQEFRYQPATYQGKPARFKCTELMTVR